MSLSRPAKRLRGKQSLQAWHLDEPLQGENKDATKEIYLVSLPHPKQLATRDGVALRAPSTYTREEIRDAILDVCVAPAYDAAFLRRMPGFVVRAVPVRKLVVFREFHKEVQGGQANVHYHVALQLGVAWRFMPLKRALLLRFNLASHWSCEHVHYSSVVSYGIRWTPKKPRDALDPAPVRWPGDHPPLEIAANPPTTAQALEARRTFRVQNDSEQGKSEPRVEEIDIWPIVVRSGVRNSPDDPHAKKRLIQYAKENCSPKTVAWLFKNRDRLSKVIDDIWQWEEIDKTLEEVGTSRAQRFHDARGWPCVCGGRWLHHVKESFRLNGINVPDLCRNVLRSIEEGRSEVLPVVVLLGRFGGEGKSLFFSPLRPLYGNAQVQARPPSGNFSLLGIENAKVALLDEWRFMAENLPLPLQLLWMEGKPVPVCQPQNDRGQSGHSLYEGTAPVFITGQEDAVVALTRIAAVQSLGDASMLLRRLRTYTFTVPIPKPALPRIKPCPRCFACMVCAEAARASGI